MTYPKGYNPPGGPSSSGGSGAASYPKPKRHRRGAIAALIIIIFLFVIGIGAYSSTKSPTTSTSSNLETASNLPLSEESTSSIPSSGPSEPVSSSGSGNCDPSYPDACIPSPPPDLDCADVSEKRFTVSGSDPHGFDRDADGVGCES